MHSNVEVNGVTEDEQMEDVKTDQVYDANETVDEETDEVSDDENEELWLVDVWKQLRIK